ncbi:MAG: O-antigen ligase family protein [Rhodospirillales bacterium]|nr:O-antigen ligase family protein [Rhodospirillales bacterium]
MTPRDAVGRNGDEAVEPRSLVLRVADNLVIALFFAPVMLAALLLGGVRDWAWAPIAGMIGVVAVLVALGFGAGRGFEVVERERRPLLVLIACFVVFVAFALLQMSSIAPDSGSAWLYAAALRILGRAHAAVPDLAVDAARNVLMRCVTCGLIFLMARAICRDRGHARTLLMLLVASAVVAVAYGLIMQVTTHGCYVGSYVKKQGEYDLGSYCLMSGTFVNSNSFASYVGMAMVAAIALVLGGRRREPDGGYDGRPLQWIEMLLSGSRVVLLAIVFFLLGGLLMSASRAGFAASVAGALVLALLLMRGKWRERPDLVRWFVAAALIVMVFGAIAGGALLTKAVRASDSSVRVAIWLASLDAIALSPWLGWGLGSFADIFTILQPASMTQPNNLAHSTPLETIVELGVIGAIPAFVVVLLPWGICLRGAFRREYRHRILPAAAFAIAAVPILHSMVDFSLQIPAIGYVTSALLGMGWAQAFGRGGATSRPARPIST